MVDIKGKKIKIFAFKGPESNGVSGGIEVYEKEFANVLENMGADVEIYCGRDKNEENLPSFERISEHITVRRFDSPFNFLPFCLFPMHWYHLTKGRKDTDFVIENQSVIPMLTPLFYKDTLFTIIHHLTGRDFIRKQGRIKGTIGYFSENFILPHMYKHQPILTVSEHSKNDIVSAGLKANNITVIPPIVQTSGLDHSYTDERKNIISYIGRYTGKNGNKKINHIIEIFPQILKEVPDAKLIIAGSMKKENELIELVNKLKLNEYVKFKGFISEYEKAEILAQSKVFASPSYQEGFGITYIEAHSYGTPVVGYKIEGLDTVPSNAGIMVLRDDKNLLVKGIIKYMKNSNFWEEQSLNSRKNAMKYSYGSVEKMIKKYIETRERDYE